MKQQIFLVDLYGINKLAPAGEVVFRFATQKYASGGYTYLPKLKHPALIGYSIDLSSRFGGKLSSSIGEIQLNNFTRDLDYLKQLYLFTGHRVVLSVVEKGKSISTATVLLSQLVEQLIPEWEVISIRLADFSTKLDIPIQNEKYLGNTNSAQVYTGLEGDTSLKDKAKPLLFGRVNNVAGTLVNAYTLVDQISSTKVDIVVNAFSDGAYISRGNLVTDINAAPYPEAGYYNYTDKTATSEGAFCRRGMEGGQITYSVVCDKNPINLSVAGVTRSILNFTGMIYIPTGSQGDLDLKALDAANAAQVGISVSEGQTISDVLTEITSSIGAYWGFDSLGNFRIFRFEAPLLANSIYTIENLFSEHKPYGVTSLTSQEFQFQGKLATVTKIQVQYDKNYTVLDISSLADVVPEERKNWFSNEYRIAPASQTTQGYSPTQEVTVPTLLVSDISANLEAYRLLDLYGDDINPRIQVDLTVVLPYAVMKTLFPGEVITLKLPRYGFDTGVAFTIMYCELNFSEGSTYQDGFGSVNLSLWG